MRRVLQVCYVCTHKIHGHPVYIGKEQYRHKRCEPGSDRWMRIQESIPEQKRSKVYEYFLEGKKESA